MLRDLLAGPQACARAWRGWRRRGRLTWRARLGLVLTAVLGGLVVAAPMAWAADSQDNDAGVLGSFDFVGASGISIGQYTLDLDHGGITDPTQAVLGTLVSLSWDLYRQCVGVAIWLYNEGTGFGWLDAIRPPAEAVVRAVQTVSTQIGVIPMALTLAALICGVWLLRGRWAGGLAELFVSCLMATLATGVLSQPVDVLAGQDGLLGRSQQFGLEMSAMIASPGVNSTDPAVLRTQTSGALVDAFLRGPHQIVNYGAIVDDSPECKRVYDKVLKAGPYVAPDLSDPSQLLDPANLLDPMGDASPRKQIGKCDEDHGGDYAAYADNPSTTQLAGMLVLLPGAFLLLLLMLSLVAVLFIASAMVVLEAARLVIGLIKGIVPGGARDGLYQGMASLAVSLVILIGSLVFLSTYVLMIRQTLQVEPGQARDPVAIFLTMDLLLLTGLVVLFRWRSQARRAASRMADRLSQLSPGGATRAPASGGFPMRTALGVAGGLIGTRLTSYALGSSVRRGAGDMIGGTPDGGGPPGTAGVGAGGGSGGRAPGPAANGRGAPVPAGTGSAATRLQARLASQMGPRNARYARLWGKAGMAVGKTVLASTVGAPVYLPRLIRAAPNWTRNRSAALRNTLQSATRTAVTHPQTRTAAAFSREYGHNVATALRGVGRYSGANYVGARAAHAAGNAAVAPAAAATILTAAPPSGASRIPTRAANHAPPTPGPAAGVPAGPGVPRPTPATGPAGVPPRPASLPPTPPSAPRRRPGPPPPVRFQAPGQGSNGSGTT